MKEIIEGDARFTVRDIAWKVGMSLSTVYLILKKYLKVRDIFARYRKMEYFRVTKVTRLCLKNMRINIRVF